MKELLITLITLAGLFIGVYYHDSLVGGGQEDQQQKTETSVSGPGNALSGQGKMGVLGK